MNNPSDSRTTTLEMLATEPVFRYFFELSAIPRCSGNEIALSNHLESFAADHGLPCHKDPAGNVIIRRNQGPGTVLLQGHMDMVCLKEEDSLHDFTKDPIRCKVNEDWLHAEKTTLGADNGIGCAWMMALLTDPTYIGPPLICVFTTNEEEGMTGASALDLNDLPVNRMINLDTEESGVIYISSAGGIICQLTLPILHKEKTGYGYKVRIDGLLGGHSGIDIGQGRGNAAVLLGRALSHLVEEGISIRIRSIHAGTKHNAIPHQGEVDLILLHEADRSRFQEILHTSESIFRLEHRDTDGDIHITHEELGLQDWPVLTRLDTMTLLGVLTLMPNGVMDWSTALPGLVETSTNLGIVETTSTTVRFTASLRSSNPGNLKLLEERFRLLQAPFGLTIDFQHPYPSWPLKANTPLQQAALVSWKEITGKDARLAAVHAGLECGFFSTKKPMLDIISIGPDAFDIHTPKERVSITSVRKGYLYLLDLLTRIR